MNIFLDAVSKTGYISLFDDSRNILAKEKISILGNESSKFPQIFDDFLLKNNLNYSEIKNIVLVHWPWSFTGIRAISLIANTIAFTNKAFITELSYFDLFTKYPICKKSSKRDVFFQKNESSSIQIVPNKEVQEYIKDFEIDTVSWEFDFIWFESILSLQPDYKNIIQKTLFEKKKICSPLYIKKPNIS